jgi:hypothetical protein
MNGGRCVGQLEIGLMSSSTLVGESDCIVELLALVADHCFQVYIPGVVLGCYSGYFLVAGSNRALLHERGVLVWRNMDWLFIYVNLFIVLKDYWLFTGSVFLLLLFKILLVKLIRALSFILKYFKFLKFLF